jgi:hypothetical protein
MKPWFRAAAIIAVLAPVAGCQFITDDPNPCDALALDIGLRNPYTGTCDSFGGGGGGGGCDEPLPAEPAPGSNDEADRAPAPDWASCASGCEGLDEFTCAATAGCRGAYVDGSLCEGGLCPQYYQFFECWGVAPSGPVQGGDCYLLDAYECSRHDDCSAVYAGDPSTGAASFAYCQPEPGNLNSCASIDCGFGYHCEEACTGGGGGSPGGMDQGVPCEDRNGDGLCDDGSCYPVCVPDNNTCAAVDCGPGYHCEDSCAYPGDGGPQEAPCVDADGDGQCDDAACYPVCVPDGGETCENIACGPGYHCELECLACDPNSGEMCGCRATCVPDQKIGCELVECGPGYHCEQTCYPCDPIPGQDVCPAYCDIACVQDTAPDPGECYGDTLCERVAPACPEGTTPGIINGCYSGFCIPLSDCGPRDPGTCDREVACDSLPPQCPQDTVPGVVNACWSGYCIPLWACEAPATCEELTTERECLQRGGECAPVYTGRNCSCDASGICTCEVVEFSRCETLFATQPQ